MVALPLFHHVGDDEIALVGRQFGHRRDDVEIGVAVGQVELTHLLLVIGQAIGIVAGARGEDLGDAGLLGRHLTAQAPVREMLVADDVDLADAALRALVDFEHDIDAVLIEQHHLGIDVGSEAALAAI